MSNEPRDNGECYRRAFEAIQDHALMRVFKTLFDEFREPVIVHGYPRLTCDGPLAGRKYGHAWIEAGRMVCNVGSDDGDDIKFFPRARFYEAGRIEPAECSRWTYRQSRQLAFVTEHYGPWGPRPAEAIFSAEVA